MSGAGKSSVEMRRQDFPVVRLLGIIGWTLTVLIAVAIPAFYYTFAIRSERAALQIETAYTAKEIQQIVFDRPELWEFETVRLLEVVSRRTVMDGEDERTIYDATGKIVIETKYKVPGAGITSTAPFYTTGFEAGYVQGKRSVRGILWGTAFAGILGLIFGLVNILFFKSYPLRLLKEALARLSAEKEKTEMTLSSIGDGVMTVDRQGRITYLNAVAERCTGWRSDEALGRNFKDCYVTLGESERIEGEVHVPCTLLSRNGEQRTIEEVWSPIEDKNSMEEGHVIVFRDVTVKRYMERQLQRAQKLESLSVLAGGIAHDFNNLLTVVLGHAELALNEISPMSPAHGSLTEITSAARRAADLSLQMLSYTGKTVFTPERVGLSELVGEMAHLLKTAIPKKVEMALNLEPGLPPIQADKTQIREIVMTLIINASEALGDRSGAIAVSVGATRCDEEFLRNTELHDDLLPGLYVHLKVTDTGIGMDEKTRSRIFEPFFSTKFTGRGLGLAAVLGIVRAHKGTIKVCSEPGKGTTFEVLFPSLGEGEDTTRKSVPSPPADGRSQGTILLVDDDESLIALGARMLEHLGFTVLTASDGLQAVERYRERGKEIDLVLMDLTMPRMDGAEAFGELRRLNPDVRVVLASGYAEDDMSSRFEGRTPSGMIQKPYTLAKLRETLAGLLQTRPAGEG